jgi:molybdopterin synthase catalytic subunit
MRGEGAAAPAVWVRVTRDPIDPTELLARVGRDEDGAVLLFLGTVRNHHEGRGVRGLGYEAYLPMAREVLHDLAREARERLGDGRVAAIHRVGELSVGDVSVGIAVSSPHRSEAYEASRTLMEELKRRLPVWKHERYVDGSTDWVDGVPVEGPDESARHRPPGDS